MTIDGYVHQFDTDPLETEEWLDRSTGHRLRGKVRPLPGVQAHRAGPQRQVGTPAEVSTPYVNTIPTDEQGWFPGDVEIERRIRASSAGTPRSASRQHPADGIGGTSTRLVGAPTKSGSTTSSAGRPTASPEIRSTSRATPSLGPRLGLLEGRFDESHPTTSSQIGGGASAATRTRGSCPTSESSRCRWASAPSTRSTRPASTYPQHRHLDDTSRSRVVLPRRRRDRRARVARLDLAGHLRGARQPHLGHQPQPQRLDGPVRGNGKIIQELEAIFRGAGWNVIKVIWDLAGTIRSPATSTACCCTR